MAQPSSSSSLTFRTTPPSRTLTTRTEPSSFPMLWSSGRRGRHHSKPALNCPDKNPYGRFRLDMDTRLDLAAAGPAVQHREPVLYRDDYYRVRMRIHMRTCDLSAVESPDIPGRFTTTFHARSLRT